MCDAISDDGCVRARALTLDCLVTATVLRLYGTTIDLRLSGRRRAAAICFGCRWSRWLMDGAGILGVNRPQIARFNENWVYFSALLVVVRSGDECMCVRVGALCETETVSERVCVCVSETADCDCLVRCAPIGTK